MFFDKQECPVHPAIDIKNYLPEIGKNEMIQSLLEGLLCDKKHISSMFFYDETGSKLFEDITRLPEYYIPDVEMPLIKQAGAHLGNRLKDVDVIELGSGDCSKITAFLDSTPREYLPTLRYIPVDVSHSAIMESAEILPHTFPGLRIYGVLADFVKQVELIPNGDRHIFCLFGSTIGNFTRKQAVHFCTDVAGVMQDDDVFLLGMDMVKDRDILHKAYNDTSGITARFNKNVINVVNSFLETSINPDLFEHYAFFNEDEARIEMHLRALTRIEAKSPHADTLLLIEKDETIHTENSHKFTPGDIQAIKQYAGLKTGKIFSDSEGWFSLVEFVKK